MQVLVFQYDFETTQYITGNSETMPSGTTLQQAQAKAKQFWAGLESDQPKQIFIRDGNGRNVYYFDNFKAFICRPTENN